MDALQEFLDVLRTSGYVQGNFLGLLNLLIGRRIEDAQGRIISTGLTWRVVASSLKKCRWDKQAVRELGLDPAQLPPRDRERFWYHAIAQAQVASDKAVAAGNRLAETLRAAGYKISPSPC
jgi:hypothetical protein